MGSQPDPLIFLNLVVCISLSCSFILHAAAAFSEGNVSINREKVIGRIDGDFICATLDWWPPEKCELRCSWGGASLLNLDLNNTKLLNAIKAFTPLKLRLGGNLQDFIVYDTEDNQLPCPKFFKNESEMFSFSAGCLPMNRWDQLNVLFKNAGAKIIFGLNVLTGRSVKANGYSTGAWDYTNAESLIRYTVKKNYTIHGWELGNELNEKGVGTSLTADQYAMDTIILRNLVHRIYEDVEDKPLIIAPGGFFNESWYKDFIDKAGPSLDVATHHIYNLGPGVGRRLVERILDPDYLDGVDETFSQLENILNTSATSAVAWVGEGGGAFNSGGHLVSNAFVYSFWYLDQLGMSSAHNTKTYCRQALVGGNYGLLNTTTFEPNPDYYSALLWHRLMGRNVLSTSFSGTKYIRSYAVCAKQSQGITLLLLNLDQRTTVNVSADFINQPQASPCGNMREEYHLTAKDGDLHSQTLLLNGLILSVNAAGEIPPLEPLPIHSTNPVKVDPLSIVFVHLPRVILPACSE